MKPEIHINIQSSGIRELPSSVFQYQSYITELDLSYMINLMRTPDFTGIPNLKYLNLEKCSNLEEIHHSLGCCRKLIRLNLRYCKSLKRFPCFNVESLEYLDFEFCYMLEKFPEIHGIREQPSSITQYQTRITKLDLSGMRSLVALPSSIYKLKSLVFLNVSRCSKLESLPEEIGDLDYLEKLHAIDTLISRPPSSIVRLNKLKILMFGGFEDGVHFEFPPVAEGLRSLEHLDLTCCNLIDGGLPEDIGSLSSLKKLELHGNNFEHLPRSIAQLGALRYLGLSYCERLTQLPELPPELNELRVDCHMAMKSIHDLVTKRKKLQRVKLSAHNDSIYNLFAHALFQNISSLRHDISASDSLSENVFTIWHSETKIPSWFHHKGWGNSVSVNLPESWYIPDKFLGFAVCYCGSLIDTTSQLIPVCDDGMSCMIQKLALSNHSECDTESSDNSEWDTEVDINFFFVNSDDSERYKLIHFFLVLLAVLWDTSKANGKTPNDYGIIRLSFSGEMKEYGLHLLYKEEAEVETDESSCCFCRCRIL